MKADIVTNVFVPQVWEPILADHATGWKQNTAPHIPSWGSRALYTFIADSSDLRALVGMAPAPSVLPSATSDWLASDPMDVDEEEAEDDGIDHEQELIRLLEADHYALEQAIEERLDTADDHDDELSAIGGGAEEEEGQERQDEGDDGNDGNDGDDSDDSNDDDDGSDGEAIEAEAEAEAGERENLRERPSRVSAVSAVLAISEQIRMGYDGGAGANPGADAAANAALLLQLRPNRQQQQQQHTLSNGASGTK
jgi:hypothetical protein